MLKLQVIGNIGRDAVIKEVNGKTTINFSVAENQKYKNNEGENVEKTTWVSCTMWKEINSSTRLTDYLIKGTKVHVDGIPSVRIYKDDQGKSQISLNLKVIGLELLESKRTDQENPEINELPPSEVLSALEPKDIPF